MGFKFTLDGINTEEIETKYNISILSNLEVNKNENEIKNITKITELETESISFKDQSKKIHTCEISMIDYKTNKLTNQMSYNCYWCRHYFESTPVGCPIEYAPNTAIKKYFSEISKDDYVIKEHISTNKNLLDNLSLNVRNYYISDGIFCSFNCALAFAKDNKHKKMYDNSVILLNKILSEITGNANFSIDPAPHWRLLKDYGGNMTIEKFRESFNKSYFESYGVIKNIPDFRSIGWLYEKKLKF